MINETIPVDKLGRYGPIVQVMTSIGYFTFFTFGKGLPSGDYDPALGVDN